MKRAWFLFWLIGTAFVVLISLYIGIYLIICQNISFSWKLFLGSFLICLSISIITSLLVYWMRGSVLLVIVDRDLIQTDNKELNIFIAGNRESIRENNLQIKRYFIHPGNYEIYIPNINRMASVILYPGEMTSIFIQGEESK